MGESISDEAERLEVRYEDGTSTDVPLTWVSPPIDAGFYHVRVPEEHLRAGARPTELVLYDADGDVVARERVPIPDPLSESDPATGVPLIVRYDERRLLHSIRTENGRTIELYDAPSRRSGRCAWLESEGRLTRAFYGCTAEPRKVAGIGAGIAGGANPMLLNGLVASDAATIELRFQDGDRIVVPAVQGFILAELPRRHWKPGHRLELVVAFDRSGAELGRQRFDPTSRGMYPCAKEEELDLGLGVTTCP